MGERGCVFPQPPPLLLSRTKLASKPKKLVEKHRVRPPPTPPLFFFGSRAERASKPKRCLQVGGLRPPPPTPPASFKPYQACFKAQETKEMTGYLSKM